MIMVMCSIYIYRDGDIGLAWFGCVCEEIDHETKPLGGGATAQFRHKFLGLTANTMQVWPGYLHAISFVLNVSTS